MRNHPQLLLGVLFLASWCAPGCSGGPSAQLTRIQSEKQELISTVEQERAAKQAAQERAASLEARLDVSEKEIARLTGKGGASDSTLRSATTQSPTRSSSPGARPSAGAAAPSSSKEERLPWRAPRAAAADIKQQSFTTEEPKEAQAAKSLSIRALAQRDSRLEYDPATDTARFNLDIPFEADASSLAAAGKNRLDSLATWLKSEETSSLQVLVRGSQAKTVVDYLDNHGIAAERLTVAKSPHTSKADKEGQTATIPVQIYLANPGASPTELSGRAGAFRR